jgi:hypothetical protein
VKTTIEIADPLFTRAKQHARRTGRPLRALVEEGLRLVLQAEASREQYRLPDRSAGKRSGPNPLEALSWAELRDEIYGGR